MSTMVLKLGPRDHGRALTYDEYREAEYRAGYNYEIIGGRLYVSPQPAQPHDTAEGWLYWKLRMYVHEHPEHMNHVSNKAEVTVKRGKKPTIPGPDITGFKDYPQDRADEVQWHELKPILVVEIMGKRSVKKDLDRNVKLYRKIPSIREYWVLDIRSGAFKPILIVHRRRRLEWQVLTVPFGETYTTRMLPGFELVVNPRA
jgi:Uma2 family endonuclease